MLPTHLDVEVLANVLNCVTSHIAIHAVVIDEFGSISDARLLWCNRSYIKLRDVPVEDNQSMAETYIDSHVALAYVEKAWNEGKAFQYFEITPSARYGNGGVRVPTIVNWQRIGDYVVEFDSDLREYNELQTALGDQTSAAAVSHTNRAVAEERERIGHDLHDSVIQQLYASALSLSTLAKLHNQHYPHEHIMSSEISKVSANIETVIT